METTKISFGKNKNKSLNELDEEYKIWLYSLNLEELPETIQDKKAEMELIQSLLNPDEFHLLFGKYKDCRFDLIKKTQHKYCNFIKTLDTSKSYKMSAFKKYVS